MGNHNNNTNNTNDIRVAWKSDRGARRWWRCSGLAGLEPGRRKGRLHSSAYLLCPTLRTVAKLAGMEAAFATATTGTTGSAVEVVEVVEEYVGTGSTDFWGISFAFSGIDQEAMSGEALERELRLMRACWTFFDDVRSRVSAEMQRGPRGGGRDRDRIVRHVILNEQDWAPRDRPQEDQEDQEAILTEEGLKAHREAYCNAIRELHSQNKMARKWPLRYLIRHTAFHTLDHAWEMEDKDYCQR